MVPRTNKKAVGIRLETGEVFLQTGRALALDHEIRSEGVEDADGQHGDVGCPRDCALGVLGFLAVNRGGLEADERGKVE